MRRVRLNRHYLSEINITSLMDICLNLLTIFILVAPLMQQGIPVDLPETTDSQPLNKERTVLISLDRDARIYYEGRRFTLESLAKMIVAMKLQNPDLTVLLEADKNVSYGQVIEVMNKLRMGGVKEVGLVTEEDESQK